MTPKIVEKVMQLSEMQGIDLLEACKTDFERFALDVYRYQYQENLLYRSYNDALRVNPDHIRSMLQIPFLPISFFKTHDVLTHFSRTAAKVFESSGTTGMATSKHFVHDLELYHQLALNGFESVYGSVKDWTILALLPSYLERNNSSLVYMVEYFMQQSGQPDNGFYLQDFALLAQKLQLLKAQKKSKILLLGVTFALLDFAAAFPMDLEGVVVMETGGMKGRREEQTRQEVQEFLIGQFNLQSVHSEYGMTELLSQAYATNNGIFKPSAGMKVLVRDVNDPLDTVIVGTGAINIIDLGNIHSCSFIATEDLGRVAPDGSFEVLGRMDFTALRGCSLLAL